jgi:cell division protein FtsQ
VTPPAQVRDGPARPGTRPAGRRRIRWRATFPIALGTVIVLAAAWALLGSSLLVVRRIEVTGGAGIPAGQVRAASGIRPGTPLVRLDLTTAARRVERITRVLSARVTRSWPDTVIIAVLARTPALAVASAGRFELVDPHGVVVRTVARRPAGLPLLAPAPARLRGNPAVSAAAGVLRELPASVRRRVVSVSAAAPDAVTLRLQGQITVRWGGTGGAAIKARELRALLRTRAHYYDISSPAEAVTAG